MEKLSLKELEQQFDDIYHILMDINLSLNNYERLFQSKYPYEDRIKEHGFFSHHFRQLKFIMIIQLAKLVSNNDRQRINFWKLLNCLENKKFESDFKVHLANNKYDWQLKSRQDVISFVKNMRKEFEENIPLIKKIETARDKVFAHYDPKYEGTALSNDEIKEMVLFISSKFNELRLHIFGSQIDFRNMIGWEVDYVLQEISENRIERVRKFNEKRSRRE